MKLPQYKRITKTDVKEMPNWFEPVADALNRQLEVITTLGQGNIAFGDNFQAEVRQIEIPHFPTDGKIASVKLQVLRTNPIGVIVLDCSFFEFYRMAWRMSRTDALTVDVKMRYDSAPSKIPTVTLLFIGG